MQYLTALEKLYLEACPELISLPKSIHYLTSLQYLIILDCRSLRSLRNEIGHLTSLSPLLIWDCPKSMSLPEQVQNLNMLRVENMGMSISKEEESGRERRGLTKDSLHPFTDINQKVIQWSLQTWRLEWLAFWISEYDVVHSTVVLSHMLLFPSKTITLKVHDVSLYAILHGKNAAIWLPCSTFHDLYRWDDTLVIICRINDDKLKSRFL